MDSNEQSTAKRGPALLKASLRVFAWIGGAAAGLGLLAGMGVALNRTGAGKQAKLLAEGAIHGLTAPISHSWESVQRKVDDLSRAHDENERLRMENSHLRLRVESLQFGCQAKAAEETTRKFSSRLSRETGTKIGRTLASFSYKVPEHLSPTQLYALGVSYFKAKENEKAAAILSFLTSLEDSDAYRAPRDFLMAGIAWYRLDNFEIAEKFLDEILKTPETAATLSYHAKARVWKGLISERLGKHVKSQFWLRELIDHHPHSTEAGWVNGRGVREIASQRQNQKFNDPHEAEEKHEASSDHH